MSTHIERLNFAAEAGYSPIEAAIHTSRYLLARQFCRDSRVLDISCGEGYGSFIMAEHWGAAHVDALDRSEQAIEQAKATFHSERIHWHCADAEQAASVLEAGSYDLIVSLETIEHLPHPERFLEQLRRLIKPHGVILLSCPNDHWYYPDATDSNPYHLHTFTFEEFCALTQRMLGPAAQFLLGVPVAGFGNFPIAALEAGGVPAAATLELLDRQPTGIIVPPSDAIASGNCSYFVGIWGAQDRPADISSSVFPQAMDGGLYVTLDTLRADRAEAIQTLKTVEREHGRTAERLEASLAAMTAERDATRASADAVEAELAAARTTLEETSMALVSSAHELAEIRLELASTRSRLGIRTAEYEYGQFELRRTQADLAAARDRLALMRNPARWLLKKAYHKIKAKAKNVPLLRTIYHRVKNQARQVPLLRRVYRKIKAIKQRLA